MIIPVRLPARVAAELRRRARSSGRSVEAEAGHLLAKGLPELAARVVESRLKAEGAPEPRPQGAFTASAASLTSLQPSPSGDGCGGKA